MELWRQNRSGSGNYFLESFNYEQGDGMMKTFFHTMQNLGFLGISVSTQMDQSSGGSRGESGGLSIFLCLRAAKALARLRGYTGWS